MCQVEGRPSAESDNYEQWLRSEFYFRYRTDKTTSKLQDIGSLLSGIMDNKKAYNERLIIKASVQCIYPRNLPSEMIVPTIETDC